jgi:hypothetical protein
MPRDFESWHREFLALAEHVEREGWDRVQSSPITVRDRAFRAASYYRAADFLLHGDPADPRITSTWASATEQFNQAIARLTPAGERLTSRRTDSGSRQSSTERHPRLRPGRPS